MKKKYMLILLVFLLTIGFASVSTTLVMNGTIGVAHKKSDFNVIFKNATVTGNTAAKATISENKKTITFETDKLSVVGDSAEIVYKVKNDSTQYDANVTVSCTGGNSGYTNIVSEFAGKSLPLTTPESMEAQEVRMGKISVSLTKTYDASVTKTPITCTLEVEGEERDSIVESSACEYFNGTEWTFDYTGSEQEFKVPCDGEYKVELWGAQGGYGGHSSYTSGNINFDLNSKLYIYVGEEGSTSLNNIKTFNGGGSTIHNVDAISGSGGGATDIRIINGDWFNFDSLKSRIMVASGSGGGFYWKEYGNSTEVGANGGGLYGYNGKVVVAKNQTASKAPAYSYTASQISGGSGTTGGYYTNGLAGSFGIGGSISTIRNGAGAGGSGYYGGGSGGEGGYTSSTGSSGSSFISGHDGCDAIDKSSTSSNIIHTGQPNHYSGYIFTNTKMIDGAGHAWTNVKGTQEKMPNPNGNYYDIGSGHKGNGYARITLISAKNPKIEYKESLLNGANPIIKEKLVPVTIENDGTVKKADIETEWYKYEDKKWANAVILENETQPYDAGDIIPESNIESYFVWIPKYKYKLWDLGNYDSAVESTPTTSKAQKIEIVFGTENTIDQEGESCATPMTSGESGKCNVGEYMTHPAFISLGANGIWVGKYETTGSTSDVTVKPGVASLRNLTVKNMFDTAYNYQENLKSHMMKNTEWGAVAYLSHSKYGINKKVNINNNSDYLTGYSAVVGTDQSDYPGEYGTDAAKTLAYNTSTGYLASTTGNITGIYDMSGGASEYMASYMSGQIGKSGFSDVTNSNYAKYIDVYSTSSAMTKYNYRILGDATGEMGPFLTYADKNGKNRYHNSWNGGGANFIDLSYPWFFRGGNYTYGVLAGQFGIDRGNGGALNYRGFRLVLA